MWQAFEADRHRPSHRTVSAWGGPELLSNEFLFQAHQVGWRLDRARFDAMLRGKAAERATHVAAKVTEAAHERRVVACVSTTVRMRTARFLIDATGRGAIAGAAERRRVRESRPAGRQRHAVRAGGRRRRGTADRNVSRRLVVHGGAARRPAHRRRDERRRSGALAGSQSSRRLHARARRDAARVRRRGRRATDRVAGAAAGRLAPHHRATPRCRCCASAMQPRASIRCRGRACSRRCARASSPRTRSAISCARDDATASTRYRRFIADEFAGYRETLREYYAMERRWAERPFWQRRSADAARNADAPTEVALSA